MSVPKKINVIDILNNVDYDFEGYVPSEGALNFVNFIKLVNGEEGEENKTPVVHYKVLDNLFGKTKRSAIMCHRGFAKTTLMSEYLFLYIAVYGKLEGFGDVTLALYVADSAEGGAKNLRKNIEFRYNQSEFLQKYIPEVRFTDTRLEFVSRTGQTFIVKMYGGQGNIRGTKELGVRPQLVVMDDLMSDQDAKSPTIIENVNNNIHKAISKAMHPSKSKMIYLGTPFSQQDPLYTVVESGVWDVSVYPICEQFPCSKEDFKGSWEDRFPYEYVKEEYEAALAQGRPQDFDQELMLRIMSEDNRLVEEGEIIPFKRAPILHDRSSYNFYITTDFATSSKKSADYSVISVWAYSSNGDWMLVDGICKRQLMDQNIDDLFRLVQIYKPLEVGIEVTGQQGGFIQWIQQEMINKHVFFNFASDNNSNKPGIRPSTDKLSRFMTILPMFKQKKIWVSEEMLETEYGIELMNEIRNASKSGFLSKHDDVIDTISMLSLINAFKPSADVKEFKFNEDNGIFEVMDSDEDDLDNNPYLF